MELNTDRLYIRDVSVEDCLDLNRIVIDFESSEYGIYDLYSLLQAFE